MAPAAAARFPSLAPPTLALPIFAKPSEAATASNFSYKAIVLLSSSGGRLIPPVISTFAISLFRFLIDLSIRSSSALVKDLTSISRVAIAGTVFVVVPDFITVGTAVVPNFGFSKAEICKTSFAISVVALIPFSGSNPAWAASPVTLIWYIAVPLRPVLALPSNEASKTSTASAPLDNLIIKSFEVALPVSSSVVATKATLLSAFSIPTNAYKAWIKPVFISKIPGPVALSPFICQVGVNDPVGQTVSR